MTASRGPSATVEPLTLNRVMFSTAQFLLRPGRVRSIAIFVYVCLVFLSARISNKTNFTKFSVQVYPWPWLGPLVTTTHYIVLPGLRFVDDALFSRITLHLLTHHRDSTGAASGAACYRRLRCYSCVFCVFC